MSNNAAVLQSGYSIGEVADRVGISVDTLRYYEKAGLLNGVARTESGRRLYSDDDCGWILFVRRLRGTAMPIGEIAQYAKMVRDGAGTTSERRRVLEAHRERVRRAHDELADALAVLDRKIEHYEAAEHGVDVGCSDDPVSSVRLSAGKV
jgi:MerR family transcriptional regulator, aldehyde-responsive regulator